MADVRRVEVTGKCKWEYEMGVRHWKVPIDETVHLYCPVCTAILDDGDGAGWNYCPFCGEPLDFEWSIDELEVVDQ